MGHSHAPVASKRLVWTGHENIGAVLAAEFRRAKFRTLVERRPVLYEGLVDLDLKRHRKPLSTLDAYDVSTMMRIWAG